MKAKIKFKKGVFAEIRTLPVIKGALTTHAARVADACGAGYHNHGAKVTGGRIRARASVVTDRHGSRREAKYHLLAGYADGSK